MSCPASAPVHRLIIIRTSEREALGEKRLRLVSTPRVTSQPIYMRYVHLLNSLIATRGCDAATELRVAQECHALGEPQVAAGPLCGAHIMEPSIGQSDKMLTRWHRPPDAYHCAITIVQSEKIQHARFSQTHHGIKPCHYSRQFDLLLSFKFKQRTAEKLRSSSNSNNAAQICFSHYIERTVEYFQRH